MVVSPLLHTQLDTLQSVIELHKEDAQQITHPVFEEKVHHEQQHCTIKQEQSTSLDKEDPEPSLATEDQKLLSSPGLEDINVTVIIIPASVTNDIAEPKPNTDCPPLLPDCSTAQSENCDSEDYVEKRGPQPGGSERHASKSTVTVHDCRMCGELCKSRVALNRHMQVHAEDAQPSFESGEHLLDHLPMHTGAIHTGERPFTCQDCGKGFTQNSLLILHCRTHTGEKPYHCTFCGKDFSGPSHLRTHITIMHQTTALSENCDEDSAERKGTQSGSNREVQIEKCGEPDINISPTGNAKAIGLCGVSDQHFASKEQLVDHLPTHKADKCKPHKCKLCGKDFTRSSHLSIHMRNHTGEKPYSCPFCAKYFSDSSNLRVHKRIHTGEKPYCCTVCGKHFVSKSQITMHARTHTGERPFKCHICNKGFKHSRGLVQHTRSYHIGQQPFPCTVCGQGFARTRSLKAHMSTH